MFNDILLTLIRRRDVGVWRTPSERCPAASELEPIVRDRMTGVGTRGEQFERFVGVLRTLIWKGEQSQGKVTK